MGLLSAGRGAVLGGLSAACTYGLRGSADPRTYLLVADSTTRPGSVPPYVRVRRTTMTAGIDRTAAPPRTTIARSLVDAAGWARTDNDARALLARAFQQQLVVAGEVEQILARMPTAPRRGLIAETAARAAAGAHGLTELDLLRLCRRHRLPAPEHQVRRTDRAGRVRYLDAYWRRWRLHAEVDGGWHTDVAAWWADMRRQNDLSVAGDRILRFPGWAVRHDAAAVAAQIRAALRAAGWPGR